MTSDEAQILPPILRVRLLNFGVEVSDVCALKRSVGDTIQEAQKADAAQVTCMLTRDMRTKEHRNQVKHTFKRDRTETFTENESRFNGM